MNEEVLHSEHPKKKASRHHPSLNIPNSIELFKRKLLHRPPSVPIFSRRLSSESGLEKEKKIRHNSKSSLKQYRRNSLPDQIDKKPEKNHKKPENKAKGALNPKESKPPLHRKLNDNKIDQNKGLKQENSAPHMRKVKKSSVKFDIPLDEVVFLTEDKRKTEVHTPSKVIKKLMDLKKIRNKQLKKIEKELVQKTTEKPKVLKFEKHVKYHCAENKTFHGKKVKKCKTPGLRTDETPCKKNRKRTEEQEKVLQTEPKARLEGPIKPVEAKKCKKVREKRKNPSKDFENAKKKLKSHTKQAKKLLKNPEWIEHSFCVKPKTQSSFFNENQDSHYLTSAGPSTNCNFLSPPVEHTYSKSSSNPSFHCPATKHPPSQPSPPKRAKLIKKPLNPEKIKQEKAALKIQSCIRGYLTRKKLKHTETSHELHTNTFIFDQDFQNQSEEVEFKQIIEELQNPEFYSFEEQEPFPEGFLEGVNDKSDFQAPRPSQMLVNENEGLENEVRPLGIFELNRKLKIEQKNYEEVQKSFDEIENFEYLDTLKQKRASIEDLRKKDLAAIQQITEKNGSEGEIYEIFQKIINRRYEKINLMFDENIKAVKEALANTVVTEESALKTDEPRSSCEQEPKERSEPSIKASEDQKNWESRVLTEKNKEINSISTSCGSTLQTDAQFYKSFEKVSNKLNFLHIKSPESKKETSPEPLSPFCVFPQAPESIHLAECDSEPSCYVEIEEYDHRNSAKIIWIDEVAMPSNLDFTELIINAAISLIIDHLFIEFFDSLFTIPPEFIVCLSENLIQTLILQVMQLDSPVFQSQLNEETIFSIIQKIFSKTQGLIVEEILKPLEKDPLMVLAEIQETEIGSAFLPDEKYSMLNIEAFHEDLFSSDQCVRIFNSLIFDCINECLELLIVKEDLPWALAKCRKVKARTYEQVVLYVANRLISFNEVKAGAIDEKDDFCRRDLDAMRMMKSEIVDEEEIWVKYEREETQSVLDVADLVLEEEIESIVEMLFNLKLV